MLPGKICPAFVLHTLMRYSMKFPARSSLPGRLLMGKSAAKLCGTTATLHERFYANELSESSVANRQN